MSRANFHRPAYGSPDELNLHRPVNMMGRLETGGPTLVRLKLRA